MSPVSASIKAISLRALPARGPKSFVRPGDHAIFDLVIPLPEQIMHRLLIAVCATLLLGACSRPTEVSSTWHESPTASRPYGKILVVGISADPRQRRRFENTLASKLEARGVTAWPSHQAMDADLEVNREAVLKIVASTGADAVIVSRLVNQEISTQEFADRTGIKTRRKTGTAIDFFRYDYDEYHEPAYLEVRTTVTLSTDVYETPRAELVYSLQTTTFDKESGFEILEEATTSIVKRLRRDRLIR